MASKEKKGAKEDDAPTRKDRDVPDVQLNAPSDPDVLLDVPTLKVDEITLEVEDLEAHLSLQARVAELVEIRAGVSARLGRVKLTITGVEAAAHLQVDLDNIADVIKTTITTLAENPELVESLSRAVRQTAEEVGGAARAALGEDGAVGRLTEAAGRTLENVSEPDGLLAQTVSEAGEITQRTLGEGGRIVDRTLDEAGEVLGEEEVGSVLDLEQLGEAGEDEAGNPLRRARGASGRVVEYALGDDDEVLGARVVDEDEDESDEAEG